MRRFFARLVQVFNVIGTIAILGLVYVFIFGEEGSLSYGVVDTSNCSEAIIYIIASVFLVPTGFLVFMLSVIAAVAKYVSWYWVLLSVFIVVTAPLLGWMLCYYG